MALKWAADERCVALLSNQDTVALVDVQEARLLWTIDFKLRFFADLSCSKGGSVFVMGNKFMMTKLEQGKELESANVHSEGISLKASSTVLLTTERAHFVGTSAGNVNRLEVENLDQSYLVNCPDRSAVTTVSLRLFQRHSHDEFR